MSNTAPIEGNLGVQSVVYQDFSLEELLAELERLDVTNLDLWDAHLSPNDDEETIEDAQSRIREAGVSVRGYGVIDIEDPSEVEAYVAFADRLGAEYLTVNFPPDDDEIVETLLEHAEAVDLDIAIHNYSTVHHDDLESVFSSLEDVRKVLERYDHPNLGVCVDTGHFLVMDESPEDVISNLGDRVVAVHLKDTSGSEIEDLPGAGALNLSTVLELLGTHVDHTVPIIIEYELPAERASEALAEAIENVDDARSP